MTIPGRGIPLDKRFEVGMDLMHLKNKNGAHWAGGMDERGELGSERKTEPQRESRSCSEHEEKPQEDADPPPNGLRFILGADNLFEKVDVRCEGRREVKVDPKIWV